MLSADLVTQTLGLTDKVISTVLLVQISLSPFTLYLTISVWEVLLHPDLFMEVGSNANRLFICI